MSAFTFGAFLVKSLGLALLGLTLAALLRRSSANRRHLVLVASLGALLFLPVAELVLPAIPLPVLPQLTAAPRANAAPAIADPQVGEPGVIMTTTSPLTVRPVRAQSVVPWLGSSWSLTPVLIVTALLLLRLLAGILRLRWLVRGGAPLPVTGSVAEAMVTAGVDPDSCRVSLVPSLTIPFTCGSRRPVVALPSAAADWAPALLKSVLVHELSHVRRQDWLVQNLARIAVALHWFNPLAWLALRRLRLEAEHACDDAVLLAGGDGPQYASELVRLARRHGRLRPAFGVAMASPSQLGRRVLAILDTNRRRSRSAHRGRVAAATFACLTAAALGAVVPTYRSEASGAEHYGGEDPLLLVAARRGDAARVAKLLDAGADIDQVFPGDGTALIVAASDGRLGMAELLLARGADVDLAVPGDGTALIAAAADGHLEIVALLLQAGAAPDLVVPGDENPLIQAAEAGHLEVVQTLVEAGADINIAVWANRARDDIGGELRSALSQARHNSHRDIEDYLLAVGATDR